MKKHKVLFLFLIILVPLLLLAFYTFFKDIKKCPLGHCWPIYLAGLWVYLDDEVAKQVFNNKYVFHLEDFKLKEVPDKKIISPTPTVAISPSPTPQNCSSTEPVDWVSYRSAKHKFSFVYPKSINCNPAAFELEERLTGCVILISGDNNIIMSIGPLEPIDFDYCFPSGYGIIDNIKNIDSYQLKIGKTSYKVYDNEVTMGSEVDVHGPGLTPDNIGILIFQNNPIKLAVQFTVRSASKYQSVKEVVHKILNSLSIDN